VGGDVPAQQFQQLVGQEQRAPAAVRGRADLDGAARGALHLSPNEQHPAQVVDVADLQSGRFAQAESAKPASATRAQNRSSAAARTAPTWSLVGSVMAASARRRRGSVTASLGSLAMTRSRTAARSTALTLLTRVRTVPGASPRVIICLIHCSMCERRRSANGNCAKGTLFAARSIASTVVASHTWRAAHSV
jgi:hypothetical protein